MTRNFSLMTLCMLAVAVLCNPAPCGAESCVTNREIVIAAAGQVDVSLVRRVAEYAAQNFDVCVRIVTTAPEAAPDIGSQLTDAAKLLTARDICVVTLAALPAEGVAPFALKKDLRSGVVNVTAMSLPDSESSDAAERFARRIEKETMNVIARLLGMEECPWPHCALSPWDNAGQLDAKGRNLCPPCGENAQDILRQMGVEQVDGGCVAKPGCCEAAPAE